MTEAPLVRDLLRAAATQDPDRILVADEATSMTAAALWSYTSKLVAVVDARGLDRGMRIAVIARRSAGTVRLVIGLLALGRVPLVIDPGRDDIEHRIRAGCPALILDERGVRGPTPAEFDDEVSLAPSTDPIPPGRSDPAYLIFTSGTTATAKGVVTTQGGLAQGAADWLAAYGSPAAEGGGVLQFAGTGFDIFYADIVRALAGRYRLFICPEDVRLDPPRLVTLLREERIGIVEFTPALGRLVLDELEASGRDLPDLHQLAMGGESWRVAQLRRVLRLLPGRRVLNTYGLVETTVDNFLFEPGDALPDLPDEQVMPIGRPFPGCDAMLVDPATGVPAEHEGELWIGGSYVAAGYIDEVGELDRRALVVDRDGDARPWFPTGDLVRRDATGTYWYLGRTGSMVKIHGQRVDLELVDATLARVTGGRACITVLLDDNETLVTVVAADARTTVDAETVRAEVTRELGALATPARIMSLPALPLNRNGKLDRQRITRIAATGDPSGPSAKEPEQVLLSTDSSPLAAIGEICREEFGIETVRDDVPAADLGLDSLRLVRLLAVLGRRYHCSLPVELVFAGPTLAELASEVDRRRGRLEGRRRHERTWYPLTRAQQELLVHSALHPDPAAYVVPLVLELTGEVEAARFEAALHAVIAAHEPLHSRYVWAEEGWRAEVVDPEITLAVHDDGCDISLTTLIAQPFDLAGEPPIRAWLLRDAPGRQRLVFAVHHVATDGASGQLLLDQLAEELRSPGAVVAADPSFGDLAAEQDVPPARDLDFWRDQLAGLTPAISRDPERAGPAHRSRRLIGEGLTQDLRSAAHTQGTTVFALVMAALCECERRWSDSDDVLIGYPVSRRESAAAEALVGMFVDTAACRLRPSPATTAREMVAVVRAALAANGRHLGSACQQVMQELTRGTGRPAFASWLNFMGARERVPALPPEIVGTLLETDALPAIFDRTFYVYDDADALEIVAVTAAGVPSQVAADRLDQLHHMLTYVVRHPDEPLADADLSQPLLPISRIPATAPQRVLEFTTSAERWLDRVAITTSEESVSYRELAASVREYRSEGTLLELSRGVDGVVALLAELSRPGLTALWDPARPEEWRERYLASVTATATQDMTGAHYCLPTSGSSGVPMPVVSDVDTLLHVLVDYRHELAVTKSDRFLLTAGLAHDPLLRDVLAPLLVGASLSIPDQRQWQDPSELVEVIHRSLPTILNLTPQLARLLVTAAGDTVLASVTRIVLSGDVLRTEDLPGIRRTFPAAALFHGYGLTQTPQLASLERLRDDATEVLLGPARPGGRLVVVDRAGRPLGLGQPGELVVHGQLLASGLSAPVIEPPVKEGDRPVRLLVTGDRGELVGEGRVRFLGRMTDAVSINGHLFDPAAVDGILADHPAVVDSATLVVSERGQDFLVSAVVVDRGDVTEIELNRHLRRRLPVGLVPARVLIVDSIPRGVNGKVDQQALRRYLDDAAAPTVRSLPPQTRTEHAVAEIWQRHLRLPALGIHDNFFDLGGTSLLLLQVHADMSKRWPSLPDVLSFYERPTVAGLASSIDALRDAATGAADRPRRSSRSAERRRRTMARLGVTGRQDAEG